MDAIVLFPAIRFLWSGIPYPSHVGAVLYGCHCLVSCHKVPVGRCALVAGTASSDLDLRCSPCECVWNRLHCSWLAVHGLRHSTGMYACTYTHLYAHTYTHTHIYMHVCAHIYMYACIRDLKGGQLPSLPPGPLNPSLMHTHCIYCTCTCSMIIAGCLAVPVQLSDFTVESGEYIHHTCDLSSTYDLSHDLHVLFVYVFVSMFVCVQKVDYEFVYTGESGGARNVAGYEMKSDHANPMAESEL